MERYVPDPDSRAMCNNGLDGPPSQCPERDGVYQCTMVAGHYGNDHHAWGTNKLTRSWTK